MSQGHISCREYWDVWLDEVKMKLKRFQRSFKSLSVYTSTWHLHMHMVPVFCPQEAFENHTGNMHACSPFSPCPPVLWCSVGESRIKVKYDFRKIFDQAVPWLQLVVLDVKCFLADKVYKVVVLSFEVKDVFDFPFLLAIYFHMLGFYCGSWFSSIKSCLFLRRRDSWNTGWAHFMDIGRVSL